MKAPSSHAPAWILLAWIAATGIPGAPPASAASAADAEWGQFRGPGGQGISMHPGPPTRWSPTENLVWKTPLPGPGGSSPVLQGDRIYLTCYSGHAVPGIPGGDPASLRRHVVALGRADGRILWKADIAAAQPEEPKVRDHGYASSTPAADSDRVYAFLGKSGVVAFDREGRQVWRADVGSGTHGWGSAASPVIHGDVVIINASVESGSLVALDRKTGREMWRAGGMTESWNTPILVPVTEDRREIVVAIAGQVLGFDPADGKRLWSCATGIGWYMVPSLVNDGDRVYCIGGRTGGSLAVRAGGSGDVTPTRRAWTLTRGSNVPSPLLHQGHLYWLHEGTGVACCVEATSGRLVYEERIPGAGPFYASPVLAGGRIYAFTRQGRGFVLAATPRFELISRNDLGDRSSFDASPAVDGSRLLVRSDAFLHCIGDR